MKQKALEQQPIKEHIAGIAPLTYIAPLTLSTLQSSMIVECDVNIVFAMIEVLLGGTGAPGDGSRELSEIEEEIMQDVVALIARQVESVWRFPNLALTPGRRIKPSLVQQYCQANERSGRRKIRNGAGTCPGHVPDGAAPRLPRRPHSADQKG